LTRARVSVVAVDRAGNRQVATASVRIAAPRRRAT